MATEATDYMGLRELLSDEEKHVQQTTREFVNREVIPIIDSYAQEEEFPALLPQSRVLLSCIRYLPMAAGSRSNTGCRRW